MLTRQIFVFVFCLLLSSSLSADDVKQPSDQSLTLAREGNWLIILGDAIPGGQIRIHYLEAYCRAGSTGADWVNQTVIAHRSELVFQSEDSKRLQIRDTLADGLVVLHSIIAHDDEVDFRVHAHNPTKKTSEAHWAQPCVRLGTFTGFDSESENLDDYLPKCFIFLDGQLARMPTRPWATEARYTPGQVWCPADVPRSDVNPRPLSSLVPSNGLIGAFSADEQWLFATAWDSYQELFQGVARCLHSDLRLGGLQPGQSKTIRGKIYVMAADVDELLDRYQADFLEEKQSKALSKDSDDAS